MSIETEVPEEQEIAKEGVEEAPAAVETPAPEVKKAPTGPAPTPEQIAEAQRIMNVVAPIGEKVAWMELKTNKAGTTTPITPEIEKEMKEELKNYPPHAQGDSVLLEKVYRMAVGTIQLKPKAAAPAAPIGRRIVSNNPSPAGNGGAGGEPKNDAVSSLTDQERTIARKMNCSESEYAKWKGNPVITGPHAPK